jgi:SAM-dependent methyltransferase
MGSADSAINVRYCEAMLEEHGDNYLGVGWTKDARYAALRYQIMLDMIRPTNVPVELLDFGCGTSHLYEYIVSRSIRNINYSGLDLSSKMLEVSRRKHPGVTYYQEDVMDSRVTLPTFDYAVVNGIFTYKGPLSQERMLDYWQALVQRVFGLVRIGLAFNAMSKYVEWERDDLFHLPLETMASLVSQKLSRQFTVRHDYGLHEYTVYVYREPVALQPFSEAP